MHHVHDDEQRLALVAGLHRAELTLEQLWLRYFAIGGALAPVEVDAYLHGAMSIPVQEADLLAHAVNERLDELTWKHRVPYNRSLRELKPERGPLAAIVELLDGIHLAPPERLAAVAAAAGRAVGVRVGMYLIDYEQRQLIPVPAAGDSRTGGLRLDTTLAGHAFRRVETLASEAADAPCLWVPLLDGVERLGVLEIGLDNAADLYDPGLREQCRWLAHLIGHLVQATTQYGDGLDAFRRQRPRSVAAELIWQLLPPLTAGTHNFTLAGLVEPAYTLGGDAFDYAVGETTVQLAVFDAAGHSAFSGLITAAALAAYRNARRNGGGLFAQANAIDATVRELFHGSGQFITGVLAEVTLATGRLRYVAAGHPDPLLMRGGRVVKSLRGSAQRPPFGISSALLAAGSPASTELRVYEEVLQAGDWLVLYTDGITEARDRHGEFFGETRLIDFLQREAATGQPPPETVRRLITAVLDHQGGVLQDDATVLLAGWDGPPLHR